LAVESLQSRILANAGRSPGRRALAFYERSGEVDWQTYEQLLESATAHSELLRAEGLGRGDICVLVLPSDRTCATLVVATLLLGAVPLLVAPPMVKAGGVSSSLLGTLRHVVGKTGAKVVVCPEGMRGMRGDLEGLRQGVRILVWPGQPDASRRSPAEFVLPSGEDLASLQLTSGTTGFPRICVWRHSRMLAALDGMASAMGLTDQDVCLNWTPLYHDMGLVNNFLLCLTAGIPLVMMEPSEFVKRPAQWLHGLHQTGASVTWSPNFGFAITAQRVRDAEIEGVRLDGVRGFWNAAERIHLHTMQQFQARFAPYGVRWEALKTNFGCAENVGGATFSDPAGPPLVEHVDRARLYSYGIAEVVPHEKDGNRSVAVVGVGKPYAGMRVQILDEDGGSLPDGHVGEISLDSPSRMTEYLGDEVATQRALGKGLLQTGDLGYLRGGELFWVGRLLERISIRGRKLDPSDFEGVLLEIPGLREGCFAAFGVDDPVEGTQRIVIVAEVRDSTSRSPTEISGEIRGRTFDTLGVSPGEVILVRPGVLAKTSSGKRRHRHIRELYVGGQLKEHVWQPKAA
jgi:acyl-CoA synthetase (AMP-forming)/AMP-acid ligase II